jgi:molybdopterin molybdotransferase
MQEDALLTEPGFIELLKTPTSSLVRSRGSQSKKGDTLLSPPHILQPGSISLLASIGITQPKVSRLPRVAHLATGAELVDPDK